MYNARSSTRLLFLEQHLVPSPSLPPGKLVREEHSSCLRGGENEKGSKHTAFRRADAHQSCMLRRMPNNTCKYKEEHVRGKTAQSIEAFTDARGLRPPLRQGLHATSARLGQRGWLTERVPATALAKLFPRLASTRLDLGGLSAPKNEVTFRATSGGNRCGYGSGAGFAGGERFAQRPEGGPPQGAAASCPSSA